MQTTALVTTVTPNKWLRTNDGLIAGVAAGIARRLGVDPWLIRLAWLVSICAFGTGIFLYLILAYCLPREDDPLQGQRRRLLGVCWRVSRRTGVEVGLVRTMAVLLSVASFGLTVLAYFVLNFVLDSEPDSLVI